MSQSSFSSSESASITDDIIDTIQKYESDNGITALEWKMDYCQLSNDDDDDDAPTASEADPPINADEDDEDDYEDEDDDSDIFDGFIYNEISIGSNDGDNIYHPYADETAHKEFYKTVLDILKQEYNGYDFVHETILLKTKRVDRILWKMNMSDNDDDSDDNNANNSANNSDNELFE